jgi:hypothetical protein
MIIIILAQIGVLKEISSTPGGPNGGTLENSKCLSHSGGLSTSISGTSFKKQKDVS